MQTALKKAEHSTLYVAVVAFFVTDLLISNVIAAKPISPFSIFGFPVVLQAADLIFPVTYILGDVLTEVYGYKRARKAIWIGFGCNLFATGAIYLGQVLPASPDWHDQSSYEAILGTQFRIFLASLTAYLVGEFANSTILAKMKIWTEGKYLWTRTIGSTVVGQGLDSAIFCTIAFYGAPWTADGVLINLIVFQWLFKITYETAATPLTYLVVNYLKRHEGVDVYDRGTRFNPFVLAE